jgi:1,4-alpha-glucan branching enzyme
LPDQVRALILDALRHWAAEYDVDGFCFVNAENMAQGAKPFSVHYVLYAPPC